MKSHQRVAMTHWWLAAGVERQGGKENPPTSHKDSLVVGAAGRRVQRRQKPPTSCNDSLVVEFAGRWVVVDAGMWVER